VTERFVARHWLEYGALRGAVAAFGVLGFRRAGALGSRIGRLGYHPLGIRRAVVERHVAAAFPGLDRAEVVRIARASYESLGRTSIETALLPRYSRQELMALFEGEDGWDTVERGLAAGRGLIIVTGHVGNWELGGAYLAARGLPIDAVARGMENPVFERYLTQTREKLGVRIVHDAEAVRRVPRALREGRVVGFLMDQAAAGLASTWVPFFGRMAKTPRGPATFALRLRCPVVFAIALRQPSGQYRMSLEAITVEDTGDLERDVDAIVAQYTKVLEKWVRRAPEQYFWHHRRWKHQQPGTPAELGEP